MTLGLIPRPIFDTFRHSTHHPGLDLPPKMDYTPAALGNVLIRHKVTKKGMLR
jgi:hypothetical protein